MRLGLRQAGKLADTIALMEAALDGAELTVPGYMGKGTVSNPLLSELRMHWQLLAQTVARVDLDVPEEASIVGTGGNMFRDAALVAFDPERCVVGRRVSRNDGLRELLLKDYRRFLERWRIPGKVSEHELELDRVRGCGFFIAVVAHLHARRLAVSGVRLRRPGVGQYVCARRARPTARVGARVKVVVRPRIHAVPRFPRSPCTVVDGQEHPP